MTKIKIPKYIKKILIRFEENGYESFPVGGCVRDAIMGRRIHDWDIATPALPEQVVNIFPKTVPTGIKYGTVTVYSHGGHAEVTTFRADSEYSEHRHPKNVKFLSSVRGDLARRDFTINAMAMDLYGNITDPFGGREDIKSQIIRCVGNPVRRFEEDALRMFRAVRFSCSLGFEIEEGTIEAMKKCADGACEISRERILSETVKSLCSSNPQNLYKAFSAGLYKILTDKCPDKAVFENLRRLPMNPELRLAAFAASAAENADDGAELLKSLRAPASVVRLCGNTGKISCKTDEDILYALCRYERQAVFTSCAAWDLSNGTHSVERAKRLIKSGRAQPLCINGRTLLSAGIPSGEHIGLILSELLRHICRKPDDNSPEILIGMAKDIYKNSV